MLYLNGAVRRKGADFISSVAMAKHEQERHKAIRRERENAEMMSP